MDVLWSVRAYIYQNHEDCCKFMNIACEEGGVEQVHLPLRCMICDRFENEDTTLNENTARS